MLSRGRVTKTKTKNNNNKQQKQTNKHKSENVIEHIKRCGSITKKEREVIEIQRTDKGTKKNTQTKQNEQRRETGRRERQIL